MDEISITDAIAQLRDSGYTTDLEVDGGAIRCGACGGRHLPSETVIEEVLRIEGPTDPADESIVFGLRCTRCGARGVLVSAYGPSASRDEATVVAALVDGRERPPDPAR